MNRFVTILLFACSIVCVAQSSQIKSGATVYIEPMGGYEVYLAAAMVKEHVPLNLVTDKDKADFIIRSAVSQSQPAQPAVVVNNNNTNVNNGNNNAFDNGWSYGAALAAKRAAQGYSIASVAVINLQSSQIVFAYSAKSHAFVKTAEECAKHLKESIAKSNK